MLVNMPFWQGGNVKQKEERTCEMKDPIPLLDTTESIRPKQSYWKAGV